MICMLFTGLVATVKEMRELLEAEEKIVDPGELQLFRRQLAQQMSTSSKTQEVLAKNLTMEKMMQNPAAMQALVTNPKVSDTSTLGFACRGDS